MMDSPATLTLISPIRFIAEFPFFIAASPLSLSQTSKSDRRAFVARIGAADDHVVWIGLERIMRRAKKSGDG
jgi:hypothetical protein